MAAAGSVRRGPCFTPVFSSSTSVLQRASFLSLCRKDREKSRNVRMGTSLNRGHQHSMERNQCQRCRLYRPSSGAIKDQDRIRRWFWRTKSPVAKTSTRKAATVTSSRTPPIKAISRTDDAEREPQTERFVGPSSSTDAASGKEHNTPGAWHIRPLTMSIDSPRRFGGGKSGGIGAALG